MLDQNTDRSGWAMVALVALGITVAIVKTSSTEIGTLITDQIKVLFTG
ncbi:hypothetical protein HMI01_26690 [Halolactibacillus miurensis]|uniref:Uncharacterized protein n=1 Tax=Halolactibacillus miurensis TaxID=306541 RepID=A0A1I6U3A8_9BACI|nr:hypothetical protein [Halolactibacillus miurensis]GEM05681.1 hypothetical protein HMI01_26690 [Halolactibacillus miurensis]SFS95933.1 hypothetical protein SAMN05421668_12135 [Halolactibacillus miurensis]